MTGKAVNKLFRAASKDILHGRTSSITGGLHSRESKHK